MNAVVSPGTSAPLLQVEGLRAHFFTGAGVAKAVDDVAFTLRAGEALAMLGESACGKSVVGWSVLGLLEPPGRIVSGRILFEGRDLALQSAATMRTVRGRRIALISGDPATMLDPLSRVREQMIEVVLAHERIPRVIAIQRARAVLERAGIPAPDRHLLAYPDELARDMQQRIAIATALLHEPTLIVVEVPPTAMDFSTRDLLLHEVYTRARETGAATLWITDDPAVVAQVADRVCVMYAGRIVEEGSAADVLRHAAHPYTRGLVDALPLRAAPGARLRAMPGTMPSLGALPSGCAFRERCPNAIDTCVAAPEMLPFGRAGGGRAVRCHNPVALSVLTP